MFSYWEQASFLHYDILIIGSGIVGLSVALQLRQAYPEKRIMVLERGLMTTGASSRNAGFACMGSATELLADLQYMNQDEVLELFEWRRKGLELLQTKLGDQHIGYRNDGSHELIDKDTMDVCDQIDFLNELLLPVTGTPAFSRADEYLQQAGFSPDHVEGLIRNNCEGSLHTGKMLRRLTDLVIENGVEIKTGALVSKLEETGDSVRLFVEDPLRNETWQLSASICCVCTNAFTPQLLPDAAVQPGRGQVLITDPIPGLKFKGIFHFDQGYYYFRELDGRILLGGGRNLDFEKETTTALELNHQIQQTLEDKLQNIIIPGTAYRIAMRWSGIMAFGNTKKPVVKAFSSRLFGAFRMGGMGVAIGMHAAVLLRDEIKASGNT